MKKLVTTLLMFFAISVFASNQSANTTVKKLYHNLSHIKPLSMTDRIKYFSKALLNKPYILGALGEGDSGLFDQEPLYRTDGFDCLTYVETVMSLAFANNLQEFANCMDIVRYQNGQVSFETRNHFTSLDWNPNAQKHGLIQDITDQIKNQKGQSVTQIATAIIDKPSWYRHLPETSIKIHRANAENIKHAHERLKELAHQFSPIQASIPYIPLSTLFDKMGQPNQFIFDQIPDAAIIEIVRPNWDLRKKTGTCLNVSHLGFAIRQQDLLLFREASSIEHKTIDIPLEQYLRQALKSPTIKGINIQKIIPQQPLPNGCRSVIQSQ